MEWVEGFYDKQGEWSGAYTGAPNADHHLKASWVGRFVEGEALRILDLGCGGGQIASVLADLGHTVIGVDLCQPAIAHAEALAAQRTDDRLRFQRGDFYELDWDQPFDAVTYFDGFGVGEDTDQRRLLHRIHDWLKPSGRALIEVYTPWYWAPLDGRTMEWAEASRRYVFDADACRMIDTWWPTHRPDEAVTQSLRCYSPADLRLLLEPTGLALNAVEPGGSYDWDAEVYTPTAPLHQALQYLAVLRRAEPAAGR